MRPRLNLRNDGHPEDEHALVTSTNVDGVSVTSNQYNTSPTSDSSASPTSISTDLFQTYMPLPSDSPSPSPSESNPPSPPTDYFVVSSSHGVSIGDNQIWGNFSSGVKAGVIIAGIFGIVAIVIASIWVCCWGPKRRRKLKAQEDMLLHGQRMAAQARAANGVGMPELPVSLMTLPGNVRRESMAPAQARGAVGRVASRLSRRVSLRGSGAVDAPPSYEEVVPPTHQRLAGGMVRRGDQNQNQNQITPMEEEDGMGVVADGKTPLSEIPFEDVVLNPTSSGRGSSSGSSSEGGRDFEYRHAMGGGNTNGHTNA